MPSRPRRPAGFALSAGALAVALPAVLALSGCGDDDPVSPAQPNPFDISTPRGAIVALEEYYGQRRVDEALAMLLPGYSFVPLDPSVIAFLGAGETSWNRETEELILREVLIPERSTWLDQILLQIDEIEIRAGATPGTVEVEAWAKLLFLVGDDFERSRSRMIYVFQVQENGDHLLLQEREIAPTDEGDMPTVSVQKARAYAEIGG
jgi:hypothetical protein